MKKIILLLLLCVNCFPADSPVKQELLVFLSSVNALGYTVDNFKIGRKSISEAGGQPCFRNNVITPGNTNYLIVMISTNSQTQNTFLNNAVVKRCYYKISDTSMIYVNGYGQSVKVKYRDYPKDLWRVQKSTP